MALKSSDLVVGKRVRVSSFPATVTQDGDYDDDGNALPETYKGQGRQVRVRDLYNTHFINLAYVDVEIPYKDGELYLDSFGRFVFYVANPDDSGKPGTWRLRLDNGNRGTTVRGFTYPARPLTPVTFGEVIAE